MNTPKIIAHRGASFDAPENTLKSVLLAWEYGADMVEIDIQITLDNQIILYHDDNFTRIHHDSKKVAEVDFSFITTLTKQQEKIPLLSEVLSSLPDEKMLLIEIKSSEQIIPHLEKVITISNKIKQVQFIAFEYDVIVALKNKFPNNICLWNIEIDKEKDSSILTPENIFQKTENGNLDGINICANASTNKNFVSFFKNKNLLVYLWTINQAEKALQYKNFGVDAIITDKPKVIISAVKNS